MRRFGKWLIKLGLTWHCRGLKHEKAPGRDMCNDCMAKMWDVIRGGASK